MKKYPVYLGNCPQYDSISVHEVLKTALRKITPAMPITGKVAIKPNLVMAHPKVATDAYTRKEVLEGVQKYLKQDCRGIDEIDVVEKSGLGITTGTSFRHAGYHEIAEKYGARLVAMEESLQKRVALNHGRVHSDIKKSPVG